MTHPGEYQSAIGDAVARSVQFQEAMHKAAADLDIQRTKEREAARRATEGAPDEALPAQP